MIQWGSALYEAVTGAVDGSQGYEKVVAMSVRDQTCLLAAGSTDTDQTESKQS